MGDLPTKNPDTPPPPPPLSLPPGFRFHPTDHQILSFYLPNKNNKTPTSILSPPPLLDVISDITNLYTYDPYDFVESDSFPYGYGGSKRHWYYFTVSRRKGAKRKSKGGYWKRKCRSRNVVGDGGGVLGSKTSFVFYKRDEVARKCCRTDWMMIEYALVDHQMDFFVLCRVFLKTCSANKVLKTGLNSHTEETLAGKNNSFTDVPRQADRPSVSGFGEVVAREEAFNNIQNQLSPELNNQVTVGRFSDRGHVSSLGALQSDHLGNFSDGFIHRGVSFDDVVAHELRNNTIFLEGDYLELDDLVGPIIDYDS